jgi:amidase
MLDPYIDAWELHELVLKNDIRPREVAESFIARIEKLNPWLNAYMTVTAERALADAARLERMPEAERRHLPLLGVAYSLKDLTPTKGIRTTMGSKNYENFVPDTDAEIAIRLARAGGILLGKTTTPELGGRPTTEGGLCPPARTPWNLAHSAGGSSGGAAAAVAAGLGPIAEGSDGGGSIRIPAACCGIVGLKPARGRVSLAPFYGESWAGFATNGPLARSVRDAAMMLDVIAGPADGDPYWAPDPVTSFKAAAVAPLPPRRLRLGAMSKSSLGDTDPEVLAAFESACATMEELGHTVEPLGADPAVQLLEPFMTVISANIAAEPMLHPELMDPIVRESYLNGKQIQAADYVTAVRTAHNLSREFIQKTAAYDALLTPTLTRPAPELGSMPRPGGSLADVLPWLPFTFLFNVTGQPAISLPNGFSKAGLPLALQIVGRPADEVTIIALAAQFEKLRPWRDQHPSIA